jgi:hypothetical protein
MATNQITRAIPSARILRFNLQGKSVLLPTARQARKRRPVLTPELQKQINESGYALIGALGRVSYLESYQNDLASYAAKFCANTEGTSRAAIAEYVLHNPAPIMYAPETGPLTLVSKGDGRPDPPAS